MIKWSEEPIDRDVPIENDIAIVHLPVMVKFRHSDTIVEDIDEYGNVLSYGSGLIMELLEQKPIVYFGQKVMILGNAVEL